MSSATNTNTAIGRLDSPLAAQIRHDGSIYTGVEPDEVWASEIRRLAAERDAVILAHNYEIPAIQDIAHHVGVQNIHFVHQFELLNF